MAKISSATTSASFGESLLAELRQSRESMQNLDSLAKNETKSKSPSFQDHLMANVKKANAEHKQADRMATDIATGKEQNLHETMLAATQAELSFNLMVQIRNKALEAYQEVMRMPV